MREMDLKRGDASAVANVFAVMWAAMVIAPAGANLPFKTPVRRSVISLFRQAGLVRGEQLTRRGKRIVDLAKAEYDRAHPIKAKRRGTWRNAQ